MIAAATIAAAFLAACEAELAALKPGNVHVHAAGHGMSVEDFRLSAAAAAPSIAMRGASVGARALGAVEATRRAVGVNTNLGIVLLAAPLAAAAERPAPDLAAGLGATLAAMTPADAAEVYAAIRLADPGGLGRAERHDVAGPAPASLREAMAEAAPRDRIARQYVAGFADVFDFGLPLLARARRRTPRAEAATTALYLGFLAAFPDSHVARKFGVAAAESLRREAAGRLAAYEAADDPDALALDLLAFDARLKAAGLNPGTSADLTVATLFAEALIAARRTH